MAADRRAPGRTVVGPAGAAAGLDVLERTTRHLQAGTDEDRAVAASAYLRLFATVIGAFLLERGARAASDDRQAGGSDWPGLARFYVSTVLPPALALEPSIMAGADLLDPVLLPAA